LDQCENTIAIIQLNHPINHKQSLSRNENNQAHSTVLLKGTEK